MYLPPPSPLPPGSIVDSYRRDSGGMRQDQSTDQQLAEIEEYCKQYNLVLRHCFVDEARSGGTTAGRDDFNRMMDLYAIPDQRPRGLLLWNYARFARDIDDAQFNKIRIRQWGIVIHSLNDSIPEGEHGRIIEFLIDVANEEKRKQTSADAKRGLKDLVLKYKCVPGTPPRGLKREPVLIGLRRDRTQHIAHRWVPDLSMKPKIYTAFEMKASGATLAQIHSTTHLFSSINSYGTFFANPLYIGVLKFGDLTIEDYCDPMIDRNTWDKVQKLLAQTAQHKNLRTMEHPRRQASSYLLSGLVFCARCKSPLWGMSAKQRNGSYYYRYACTRAKRRRDCDFQPIPARPLEDAVIQKLAGYVANPDVMEAIMETDRLDQQQKIDQSQIQIRQKQKELSSVRREITNINSAIKESGHSKSLLKTLQDLEAQETQLESRILQLKNEIPEPDPPLTREEILIFSRFLGKVLFSKDPAEVRRGLLMLTRRILVDRRSTEVFGVVNFKKRNREPSTDEEENPVIITASLSTAPMGAPLYRHSIPFSFVVGKRGNQPKRPR